MTAPWAVEELSLQGVIIVKAESTTGAPRQPVTAVKADERHPPPPNLHRAWRGAESLCIKCGFCLPVCPTYLVTGSEAASPRGRLDLLYGAAEGRLALSVIGEELSRCLGCLACETACPSAIAFGEMLDAGRADSAEAAGGGPGWLGRFFLNRVLLSPGLRRLTAWKLHLYQRSGLQALVRASRLLNLLAPRLARLEANIPPIPAPLGWRGALGGWPASGTAEPGESGPAGGLAEGEGGRRMLLFTGCVMDTLFGAVHAATVKVARSNGIEAVAPPGQGCCGALHLHAGERGRARELARAVIAAFEAAGGGPVVVNSAGCGAALKEYGRLLEEEPEWRERAERFSARVEDVSEYLAGLELSPPPLRVPLRVAYDDPCHLLHAQKIESEPRRLLAGIEGLELVELPGADSCCGGAGAYSLLQPELSRRVLERKMESIAGCGVQVVASGNPGCLLQLRLGAARAGIKLEVLHPVQLLARAYE